MNPLLGLLSLQAVVCLGLGAWSLLAALNNARGFGASVAAVARTLTMAPLQDPPRIATPFDGRALGPAWGQCMARLVVLATLLVQAAAGTCLVAAGLGFAGVPAPAAPAAPALLANAGLALLSLVWLAMLVGGLWFAYWIRQELLQLTHLALLIVCLLAALLLRA
jgi:predicted small integral membrane protein